VGARSEIVQQTPDVRNVMLSLRWTRRGGDFVWPSENLVLELGRKNGGGRGIRIATNADRKVRVLFQSRMAHVPSDASEQLD